MLLTSRHALSPAMLGECRKISAVIWSPDLGVLAVAAAGVLCAFPYVVDALPDSVSAAGPVQAPLSLLFLELSSYGVDAVRLHVIAPEVLVRHGVDREGSR